MSVSLTSLSSSMLCLIFSEIEGVFVYLLGSFADTIFLFKYGKDVGSSGISGVLVRDI